MFNKRVVWFVAVLVIAAALFLVPSTVSTPRELEEPKKPAAEAVDPTVDSTPNPGEKSEETSGATEPTEPEIKPESLQPLGLAPEYFGKGRSILPVGVSGESNGFVVGWNVPVGTVIFAPFEGRVTQTTLSPPDGSAKLMGVEVFQSSTGDWVKATLRFSAIAHNLELLVEKGTEVKPGDPIAKVTSSKIIEAVDVAKYGNFSLLLHFSTTDLSDQRFYEWYDLLVGK